MYFMARIQTSLDREIEQILRLSYDALAYKDKAIFRHIACLFNLKKVNDIKLLLADSGLDFKIGLTNLVDKSLVNVRLNMVVDMHPLLQQMGKEIVRKQSEIQPGKREFLMNAKDIRKVLEDNTVSFFRVLFIDLTL